MGAKPWSFTLALAMFVIAAIMMVKAHVSVNIVDTCRCNPQDIKDAYSGNDADVYTKSVGLTLGNLVPDAAYAPDYKLPIRSIVPPINYGFASCSGGLTTQECSTCLTFALIYIGRCDGKVGATIILVDCSLRYENYLFPDAMFN